jgi:hypothetical protein
VTLAHKLWILGQYFFGFFGFFFVAFAIAPPFFSPDS